MLRICTNFRKVLKEIHVGEMPPDETIDAMREAKLQAKLDHVGVVKCFNNFLDKDFFCIISEYCDVRMFR